MTNDMKERIRKLIEKRNQLTPDEVLEKVRETNCNIISFDVFDTLIKRNVAHPADVFSILEVHYIKNYGFKKNIKQLRIEAEHRANAMSHKEDVTLDDIYSFLEGASEEEKEWLKIEEIKLEKALCQRNNAMWQVYQECLIKGKKVFIVTDMYLPANVIIEILHSAGYYGWSAFYLSSEQNARKSTGRLFKKIINEQGVSPDEVLHIGDALRGDFIIPKQQGINALLLRRENPNTAFFNEKQAGIQYNVFSSFISNNCPVDYSYFETIGYEVVGPLLYGYCKWLYKKLKREDIKKVFFLAREGYLLQKAFETFSPEGIKHYVIKVSRHATAIPLLYKANSLEDVLERITVTRANFTVGNLLESCGINRRDIITLLKGSIFSINSQIDTLADDERQALFALIKPYIDEISKQQNNLIHGYLDQFDFNGKVAVCDVGWHGTIQNALQDINPNVDILGYYIGKKEKKGKRKSKSEAFLFDEPDFNHEIEKEIMSAPDLFELFFLSTDGSAMSYEKQNDEYICIQGTPEQSVNNAKQIVDLQNAALKFIKDFKTTDTALALKITPESCEAAYSKFVNPPSKRTVEELSNFDFLNVESHSMVASHSLGYYLIHLNEFKDEFLNNGSKSVFLKSVFKLPLPYADIIDKLRKFDK